MTKIHEKHVPSRGNSLSLYLHHPLQKRQNINTQKAGKSCVGENSTYNPRENLDVGNVGPGPRDDDLLGKA